MPGEEQVKLLTMYSSPYGMRAQLALDLKGVKYERVLEDPRAKSQLLLESNPIHKKVPVLIHNGKPICESRIILEYIDETWPSTDGKDLMPKDAYSKSVARFWGDFIDSKLMNAGTRIMKTTGEEQEKAIEDLKECIIILEGVLASTKEKPFFGGEQPGFVDVVLAPFVVWHPNFEAIGNFTIPDAEKCPCFHAWIEAVLNSQLKASLADTAKLKEFAMMIRNMFVKS